MWAVQKALLHSSVPLYSNKTTPYSSIFDATFPTDITKAALSPIEYIALQRLQFEDHLFLSIHVLALDCTRLLRSIRWRERTGWRRQRFPRAPLFKKGLYVFFERVRIGTEAPCVNSIVPFNVTLEAIQ